MGRIGVIKLERSYLCRPNHNVISSDFPKYVPAPWKFMEGPARIDFLLSNEYQRMWMVELDAWKKRMYPENEAVTENIVKRYVLTFKTMHQPPKQEKKKPFKMKKFEGIGSRTKNKRPSGDKAMAYEKNKEKPQGKSKPNSNNK